MLDVLTGNEKTTYGKKSEVGDNRWTHPNWQNGATCYSTDCVPVTYRFYLLTASPTSLSLFTILLLFHSVYYFSCRPIPSPIVLTCFCHIPV